MHTLEHLEVINHSGVVSNSVQDSDSSLYVSISGLPIPLSFPTLLINSRLGSSLLCIQIKTLCLGAAWVSVGNPWVRVLSARVLRRELGAVGRRGNLRGKSCWPFPPAVEHAQSRGSSGHLAAQHPTERAPVGIIRGLMWYEIRYKF